MKAADTHNTPRQIVDKTGGPEERSNQVQIPLDAQCTRMCIKGSGKKKNRDFGCAARKSRIDNYYHEEARAKTERRDRDGSEMGTKREREGGKKWQKEKEKKRVRLSRVARDGQDEAEEKGVGREHVDLR